MTHWGVIGPLLRGGYPLRRRRPRSRSVSRRRGSNGHPLRALTRSVSSEGRVSTGGPRGDPDPPTIYTQHPSGAPRGGGSRGPNPAHLQLLSYCIPRCEHLATLQVDGDVVVPNADRNIRSAEAWSTRARRAATASPSVSSCSSAFGLCWPLMRPPTVIIRPGGHSRGRHRASRCSLRSDWLKPRAACPMWSGFAQRELFPPLLVKSNHTKRGERKMR